MRRTTLITAGCLAVLSGLGLSRKVNFHVSDWWLLFCPLLLLAKRKTALSLVSVVSFGLILGFWRGDFYKQNLSEIQRLAGQQISLQVTATSDAIYAKGSQLEFSADHAQVLHPTRQQLAGSYKISGFGAPMVYRGDVVEVQGRLYKTRGSNQGGISYAQLAVVGKTSNPIYKLNRDFTSGMQTALPEPEASFGMGLLTGARTTLPDEINKQLLMVGLVHIVAVSGYNLTILVRASSRLRLGSKFQRLILSLSLIAVFLVVTGFHASIVRAALISSLGLWAWFYGRKIKPILLIFFTAALTGFVNPFYVWGDIGWYLSFLAFFGVLVLAPLITPKIYQHKGKLLGLVVIETLAAEIMTLPLIMMVFGQLSLIGLVANTLVVPLIPLAMLLSAIAGVAGALLPPIAGWFAWPATLLLTYILDLVRLLASIPQIFHQISINKLEMAVSYGCLVLLTTLLYKRKRSANTLNLARIKGYERTQ